MQERDLRSVIGVREWVSHYGSSHWGLDCPLGFPVVLVLLAMEVEEQSRRDTVLLDVL